jgi:tetrahydromethanopterin S-methyltransferase subunit H
MEQDIKAAMHTLHIIWARHYASVLNPHPKYVFNFQPGMTQRYLDYLLRVTKPPMADDFDKGDLAADLHEDFVHYLQTFESRKQCTFIVDQSNIESPKIKALAAPNAEPSILIVHCDDPIQDGDLKTFIQSIKRTKHSLVVFSEPLQGLRAHKIEAALKVKVRHLVCQD